MPDSEKLPETFQYFESKGPLGTSKLIKTSSSSCEVLFRPFLNKQYYLQKGNRTYPKDPKETLTPISSTTWQYYYNRAYNPLKPKPWNEAN
jgi:hypothetical protein